MRISDWSSDVCSSDLLSLKDVAATAEWTERLGGISLAPGHVRVPFGARVETLAGFAEGGWWVQDLAASLPARVLGARAGDRVLDLCAAPGGKTIDRKSKRLNSSPSCAYRMPPPAW